MAKIVENSIVIKLSKLVKIADDADHQLANDDIIFALEQVVQELVGDNIIVEVERE
jgi:hypothetical protein